MVSKFCPFMAFWRILSMICIIVLIVHDDKNMPSHYMKQGAAAVAHEDVPLSLSLNKVAEQVGKSRAACTSGPPRCLSAGLWRPPYLETSSVIWRPPYLETSSVIWRPPYLETSSVIWRPPYLFRDYYCYLVQKSLFLILTDKHI